MKLFVLSLILLVNLFSGFPQAQKRTNLISAQNFLWVSSDFCTGGQPTDQDLARLKKGGLRSVLNLQTVVEHPGVVREGVVARALGLKYVHLPVDSSRLNTKLGEDFLNIVSDESNRPLFVHCASANRVGALWILHRVVNDGWHLQEAEKEAEGIGLRSERLLEFARNYLKQAGY